MMDTLMLQCRPGFEADCAAELAWHDPQGYAKAVSGAGWLSWHSPEAARLAPRQLIFPRTGFLVREEFSDLPETDRISALLALLRPLGPVAAVRCEYADTNEGRSLERFLKRFRGALERALRADELLGSAQQPTLHLFFHDSRNGVIGLSSPGTASDWENGIPRLRLPAAAPSRSAQKIEEAWLRLMTPEERAFWLRDGRTGVDLGAAPGGWTWQLARHGVRMTAVDHGKLTPALLDEYPVTHISAADLYWRTPRTIVWLALEIYDQPARYMVDNGN